MQVTLFPDMIKCKRQGKDRWKKLNVKYWDSEADRAAVSFIKWKYDGDKDTKTEKAALREEHAYKHPKVASAFM